MCTNHPKFRLTDTDVNLLARMPITVGGAPYIHNLQEKWSWTRLLAGGLITGYPGAYSVRWGWLGVRQYNRVQHARWTVRHDGR